MNLLGMAPSETPAKPVRRWTVHYRNGREAKNGDKIVLLPQYGAPVIGILYDATDGNDYCNGKIAPIKPSDPCPNLKECLHLDDVLAAVNAQSSSPSDKSTEVEKAVVPETPK